MSRRPTRMEQLGNLLTAMFAVIVFGQTDLLIDATRAHSLQEPLPAPDAWAPSAQRLGENRRNFRPGGKYYGAQVNVAKKLGVHISTVRDAALGSRKSPRVLAALAEELDRIDAVFEPAPTYEPLTAPEIEQFGYHGRYRGLLSKVAADRGIRPQTVFKASRGQSGTQHVLGSLRAEMARVDAEFAAKKAGA